MNQQKIGMFCIKIQKNFIIKFKVLFGQTGQKQFADLKANSPKESEQTITDDKIA